MEQIYCKKCKSSRFSKNGKVRNKQQSKCLDCGCNFVLGDERSTTKPEIKALFSKNEKANKNNI